MRKLNTSFLCFFLFIASLQAQKDIAVASVRYTFTHINDTTQPENPNKENTILYLGKNMSNYTNFDRAELIRTTGSPFGRVMMSKNGGPQTPVEMPPLSPEKLNEWSSIGNYFKDFGNSKIFYIANPGGKLTAIEESMPTINWVITQDIKEIMGLPCQKATADFKGRTYEAWFSSQLPYSNGPWKLGGLPGLIIEASDTKKEVIFKMVSFENANDTQVAIEIPPAATKTSPKEYKQYQEALEKDRQAMIGSSSVSGGMAVSGRLTASTLTLDGKPVKPKQMNNPIEKETKK
ncbi:MAG: GLPGLI family protein [Sediminibacterium sp.]